MTRPVISGTDDLKEAYRDDRVAREYVGRRFETPLGSLLHRSQVAVLRRLLAAHRVEQVAEIAPGPARVTVDVAPSVARVIVLDASAQMLQEARRRLASRQLQARVGLVQADAFHLPLRTGFDLIYSFRLIRHFDRDDRIRLYRQAARVLKPGGFLVFDAVNALVSESLRAESPAEYEHFDALLRPDAIREELGAAGFTDVQLEGVQHHDRTLLKCQIYIAPRSDAIARLAMRLVDRLGGEPLEWVVSCRRA